jgi:hypothetical protein
MPAGPNCIIKHREPISEVYLARETIIESEIELSKNEDDILVEVVTDHPADPPVAPSAMDQQEPLEVTELADGIVGRPNCLGALFSSDADSNVGL